MRISRTAATLGLAATLAVTLSSCSSAPKVDQTTPAEIPPAQSSEAPEAPATQAPFSGGLYGFPLDSYADSTEGYVLHSRAERILISACMKNFGFTFTYPEIDLTRRLAQDAEARSRIYGITDLAAAKEYGYHLNPKITNLRPERQETPDSANFVLTGERPGEDLSKVEDTPTSSPGKYNSKEIPPGGCTGSARTRLIGSTTQIVQFTLAAELSKEADDAAAGDSRVRSYISSWSDCMKKKGYTLLSPRSDSGYNLFDPKVSSSEIQMATVDISCKKSTDLIAKWHKVIVEYETKALEKNQLALTEEKNQRAEMLTKASEVVAASG